VPQRPRAELAKSDLGLAPLESLNGHDGLQMWMFGSLEKKHEKQNASSHFGCNFERR